MTKEEVEFIVEMIMELPEECQIKIVEYLRALT